MARTPKKPQPSASQGAPQAPLTRRGRARWQRERDNQRRVRIIAAAAISLALVAILAGVLYDRVWLPSRPVAQVNNATLSRGDYDAERRRNIARSIAQNLQLLATFGTQLGDQFTGQTPALNGQVPNIKTSAVDDQTVNDWIDRQLIVQGAGAMNVQASDGEIAQQLVGELASIFPAPEPPPLTSTTTLSSTALVTGTSAVTRTTAPTSAATNTAIASPTSAGTSGPTSAAATPTSAATATPSGPTETPRPTATPTATPLPDQALQDQDKVIGRLFDTYVSVVQNADPQSRTNLTIDDFKAALRDQYLRQALTNKIEAQLLPEAGFTPTTDPSSITTRHILIKVTAPISATQAEADAAYAARKPDAQAILDQLRGGADFATLAKEKSEDLTTKGSGGVLPSFDKDGKTSEGSVFDPAYVKAAQALKENQISDLVRTPFGWHIIQVTSRNVDSKEDQLKTARSKAFDKWLEQQRTAANIAHFPPVSPTPTAPPTGTPEPLPTQALGGEPTAVPTTTETLTGTTTLPSAIPTATAAPALTPASGTPTTLPPDATPAALPPTPIATSQP